MNPFVRDQIEFLRESNDPRDHSQATIMEMLSKQDEVLGGIKEQTTKTNGRVTALESRCVACDQRIKSLEVPAGEIKTMCKFVAKGAAIVVAAVGVITGAQTIYAKHDASVRLEEIRSIVDHVVSQKQPQK